MKNKTFSLSIILCLLLNLFCLGKNKSTRVNTADLNITVSSNSYITPVGQNQIITFTVHNYGPDTAENVSTTISIGNCFSNVSIIPSAGTFSNNSWNIGTLNNNETVTLTMTNLMNSYCSCSYGVYYSLISSTYDPTTSSNSGDVNFNWDTLSDLEISCPTYTENLSNGSTIFLNYNLKNNGPNETCGWVNFYNTNGLTIVNATPSEGVWDNQNKSWSSILMLVNQPYNIQLECVVNDIDNLSISAYGIPNSFWEFVTENNNCTSTFSSLSNNQFQENINVKISPNPVKDILSIASISKVKNIIIYDLLGKIILQQNDNSKMINLSSLNKGFYLVKIITDDGTKTEKIIKE